MATFPEYSQYDALGLAELVQNGDVTSAELIEACIERIEQVNGDIHAVVHKMYDRARAQAKGIDTSSRTDASPFAGVPFLLKDLLQTIAGEPTSSGSRYWRGHTVDYDGAYFQRLTRAGVITVAKTATPELGLMPVTEPAGQPATRTPWDLSRTSGGSSGGSGAAVAAGVVPMASGGDGGGSIRIPSACCGIFGIKPTRGRTPAGPDSSENWNGLAIEHVLTRTVRDSAAMLDATHGPEPISHYHAPHFDGSWLEETQKDPGKLRVAFHVEPAFEAAVVHADCDAAVRDAAKLMEELGHDVEEVRPGHDARAVGRAFFTVISGNTAASLRDAERIKHKPVKPGDFETNTILSALAGKMFNAGDFCLALRDLQAESRRLRRLYADYDIVICPVLARPPAKIGELRATGAELALHEMVARFGLSAPLKLPGVVDQAVAAVFSYCAFTPVQNFTGQPSMSVPLYWNDEGVPVGTMFTGRFGDEATMFRVAAQLEKARPWRDKRPPVFAG